jgi:carbamoyltransferase
MPRKPVALLDVQRPDHALAFALLRPQASQTHAFLNAWWRAPIVVNASFNNSEAIMCTPTDAIVTFRKSGIDALFMDDVVLTAEG